MSIWHTIGRQLQQPHGLAGRFAGAAMRVINARPNLLAVEALQVEPYDNVLELGCGPGHALAVMASRCPTATVNGIDRSTVMLEQAAARNGKAIREFRVRLLAAEFERLPFRESTIDRILAVNVIYFWHDTARVLREIRRVLRPGGRLVIYATDAAAMRHWKFAAPDTHRLFDRASLAAALDDAGFDRGRRRLDEIDVMAQVRGLLAICSTDADGPCT